VSFFCVGWWQGDLIGRFFTIWAIFCKTSLEQNKPPNLREFFASISKGFLAVKLFFIPT
jgi:hypothetical protein